MAKYSWLGPLRSSVRNLVFRTLRDALQTDDGRRILADVLDGVFERPQTCLTFPDDPYRDLARPAGARPVVAPVFITGRFRSGSTLLWNIFRNVPSCTAFYEPLNERRWFDASWRGERVDPTHRGVDEYWREYAGLVHLGHYYMEDWIRRRLYMPPDAWDPRLEAYVQALVDAAAYRAVLQFNRVDFRLPWLRQVFPHARYVHIYRHPRDQWVSTLMDGTAFPRDGGIEEFAPYDHFYLLTWARDLSYVFSFLDPQAADHPYELFYLIWKLSYSFGRRYCHLSCAYETLCEQPNVEIPRIMYAAEVEDYDLDRLVRLVEPHGRKWQQYADQEWFAEREAKCEAVLARYLGIRSDDVNERN